MNILASHKKSTERWLTVLTCIIAAVLFFQADSTSSFAAGIKQKSFSSPQEAVNSLEAAIRAEDLKELSIILGPGSKELIFSGDEAADRVGREKFLKAYDQKNSLVATSSGKTVLHIGDDDWSMPVPVVKKGTKWVFDVRAGKQEILNRRIGRNELHIMDFLQVYVDAQHEYATKDCKGDGSVEFAQKMISTEGNHDGLYWETKEGEEMSPLGPLVALATKEGYANKDLQPFHGYYFKILQGQGKHAKGGAYKYVVKGKMLLGFALLAYPAQHGNSGIMSFIVNQEGLIYEKNLGKNSKLVAEKMKLFDPDKTWKKVEETSQQQDR
jgi:hypothetical protein